MPGVSGRIQVTADLSLVKAAIGSSTPKHEALLNFLMQFDAGNAALGKADVMYHAVRSTAPSATDTLDISGTVTDPLGQNIVNAEVMAIIVMAKASNVNNVLVGPAATNGFIGPWNAAADRTKVEPGDILLITSVKGWPVTAGTVDVLAFINSAGGSAVDYEVIIVGRTVVG